MKNFFTIEGLASTDTPDSYDEIIDQDGIDLSLVGENCVHINIEHAEDFPLPEMAVIGLITEARLKPDGLWIKGKIYFEHQYANVIHRELTSKTGKLQLSIEMGDCVYGTGRRSNTILSGTLMAVAITKNPANDDTYVKLAKSLQHPSLRSLVADISRLNKTIRKINSRQTKKKRVIVKILKMA